MNARYSFLWGQWAESKSSNDAQYAILVICQCVTCVLFQWDSPGAGAGSGDDQRGQHGRLGPARGRRPQPRRGQEAEDPPRGGPALQTRVPCLRQADLRPEGGDELHHQEGLCLQPSHAYLPPLEDGQCQVRTHLPNSCRRPGFWPSRQNSHGRSPIRWVFSDDTHLNSFLMTIFGTLPWMVSTEHTVACPHIHGVLSHSHHNGRAVTTRT